MTAFAKLLEAHNASIVFVGDSLMYQNFAALRCIVESEDDEALAEEINKRLILNGSCFLTELSDPYVLKERLYLGINIQSEEWLSTLKSLPSKVKIAVVNTGAWWHPVRFNKTNKSITVEELEAAYAHHFSNTSRLHKLLAPLKRDRNIILIWRDTPPAGSCDENGQAEASQFRDYFDRFYAMNAIARAFFTRMGGFVLPHIWDASVPKHQQHCFGKTNDTLHWCNHAPTSVPWMWNTVLYNELPGILRQAMQRKDAQSHTP